MGFIKSETYDVGVPSSWRLNKGPLSSKGVQWECKGVDGGQQTTLSSISNDYNTHIGIHTNQETQTSSLVELMKRSRASMTKEEKIKEKKGEYHFLKNIKDSIIKEIQKTNESKALIDYDVNWNEEINNVSCSNTFQLPDKLKSQQEEFHITDMKWSNNGEWLAVAYGNRNTIGWCMNSGYIGLYTQSSLFRLIEISESYVTALAFHPTRPNLLVAGTYDGTVKLYKIQDQDYKLMATTPIHFSHRDPVVDIKWLKHRVDKSIIIASLSTDGKIHLWSAKNQLQEPVQSYHFTNVREVPLSTSSFAFIDIHTGSTLKNKTVPTTDSFFILGCETGAICKAVLKGINLLNTSKLKPSKTPSLVKSRRNPIEFNYSSGVGYTERVECSPFHRNCFISIQSDLLRMYHVLEGSDKLTLQPAPQTRLLCASFSPFRPCVVACGAENGKLYLYDLCNELVHPSMDIDVGAAVSQLAFNPTANNVLATADDSGAVKLWQLNNKLSSLQMNELSSLKTLIGSLESTK